MAGQQKILIQVVADPSSTKKFQAQIEELAKKIDAKVNIQVDTSTSEKSINDFVKKIKNQMSRLKIGKDGIFDIGSIQTQVNKINEMLSNIGTSVGKNEKSKVNLEMDNLRTMVAEKKAALDAQKADDEAYANYESNIYNELDKAYKKHTESMQEDLQRQGKAWKTYNEEVANQADKLLDEFDRLGTAQQKALDRDYSVYLKNEAKAIQELDEQEIKVSDDFTRMTEKIQLFKEQAARNITAIQSSGVNYDSEKLNAYAKAVNTISVSDENAESKMKSLNSSYKDLSQQVSIAESKTDSFAVTLGKDALKMGIWAAAATAIYAPIRALSSAIEYVKSINEKQTNIEIITGDSKEKVNQLTQSYQKLASQLHTTTSEVLDASEIYLRAGKTEEQTASLIKSTTEMSKISGQTMSESSEELTAIMNSYNLSATQMESVVDRLTKIDNTSATSTGELADSLERTSASAKAAGVDLTKLISYAGTISSVTRQSSETIGTALNSIFSRYENVKAGVSTDSNGESVNNVEKVLTKYNIAIRTMENGKSQFRSFSNVLDDLSQKWGTLSSVEQAQISTAVAGTRQRNQFLVLMNNYSTALKMQATEANSAGSALQMYGSYTESVAAKENDLTQSLQNAANSFVNSNEIGDAAETLSVLVNTFLNLKTVVSGFITVIALLKGQEISAWFVKSFGAVTSFSNGVDNLKQKLVDYINTGGQAAQKTKELNDETAAIVNAINRNTEAVSALNSANDATAVAEESQTTAVETNSTAREANTVATETNITAQETAATAIEGESVATEAATSSTNLFTLSMEALFTAISANPIGAIAVAISALVTGMDIFNEISSQVEQKQEEERQQAQEVASSYQQQAQSLQDLISQYQKIESKTIKTSSDTSALKTLNEQLKSSYSDLAKNIDLVNGKYDTEIAKLQALSKAKANEYIRANQSAYNAAKSDLTQSSTTSFDFDYLTSIKEIWNNGDKTTSDLKKLLKGTGLSSDDLYGLKDINGTLQQRVNILSKILENSSNITNQSTYQQSVIKSVNDEYTKLKTQLDEDKTITQQMANANVYSGYSKQISQATKDVNDYNKAVESGNKKLAEKAAKDFDGVKKSVDNLKNISPDVKKAFDAIIDDLGGTTSSTESNTTAVNDNKITLNGLTVSLTDASTAEKNLEDTIKNTSTAMQSLNDDLATVNKGTQLSASEILSLAETYPQYRDKILAASDSLSAQKNILDILRQHEINEANTAIAQQILSKNSVIQNTIDKIRSYDKEIGALGSLAAAQKALALAQAEAAEISAQATSIFDSNAAKNEYTAKNNKSNAKDLLGLTGDFIEQTQKKSKTVKTDPNLQKKIDALKNLVNEYKKANISVKTQEAQLDKLLNEDSSDSSGSSKNKKKAGAITDEVSAYYSAQTSEIKKQYADGKINLSQEKERYEVLRKTLESEKESGKTLSGKILTQKQELELTKQIGDVASKIKTIKDDIFKQDLKTIEDEAGLGKISFNQEITMLEKLKSEATSKTEILDIDKKILDIQKEQTDELKSRQELLDKYNKAKLEEGEAQANKNTQILTDTGWVNVANPQDVATSQNNVNEALQSLKDYDSEHKQLSKGIADKGYNASTIPPKSTKAKKQTKLEKDLSGETTKKNDHVSTEKKGKTVKSQWVSASDYLKSVGSTSSGILAASMSNANASGINLSSLLDSIQPSVVNNNSGGNTVKNYTYNFNGDIIPNDFDSFATQIQQKVSTTNNKD